MGVEDASKNEDFSLEGGEMGVTYFNIEGCNAR